MLLDQFPPIWEYLYMMKSGLWNSSGVLNVHCGRLLSTPNKSIAPLWNLPVSAIQVNWTKPLSWSLETAPISEGDSLINWSIRHSDVSKKDTLYDKPVWVVHYVLFYQLIAWFNGCCSTLSFPWDPKRCYGLSKTHLPLHAAMSRGSSEITSRMFGTQYILLHSLNM